MYSNVLPSSGEISAILDHLRNLVERTSLKYFLRTISDQTIMPGMSKVAAMTTGIEGLRKSPSRITGSRIHPFSFLQVRSGTL
jgi:hypothetical protein